MDGQGAWRSLPAELERPGEVEQLLVARMTADRVQIGIVLEQQLPVRTDQRQVNLQQVDGKIELAENSVDASRVVAHEIVFGIGSEGLRQTLQRAFTVSEVGVPVSCEDGSRGIVRVQLQRCLERPNAYVLLVNWETLEDHTVGFRQSPVYQEWRALLHHFYDPFPVVEHYKRIF